MHHTMVPGFSRRDVVGLLVALAVLAMTAGCGRAGQPVRPLTYVALGASDAVGVGAPDPERDGWVPRFGAALGPGARIVNLGVSGSTLAQALREQLEPAVEADPDVVTVWLAINDLVGRAPLDRYADDLDRLLARLAATDARVLVGNVPDLAPIAPRAGVDPATLRAEVGRWNAAIAAVAARHGAEVVDLNAHWRELADHPEYLSVDGFHPSAAGYARLAEIFAEAYARRDR
jgi:acyl-CoA thioesterase I